MRAFLNYQPMSNTYGVFLVQDTPHGRLALRCLGPDEWEQVEVIEGELQQPTFTLHADMLEALRVAIDDAHPLTAGTIGHLKDAVQVRDRLLAMFEARGIR